jgi:hypothetical protein
MLNTLKLTEKEKEEFKSQEKEFKDQELKIKDKIEVNTDNQDK